MNFTRPKGWRKGQTIFNWLQWLKEEKDYQTDLVFFHDEERQSNSRMADPFHIPDEDFDKLWAEYLESVKCKMKQITSIGTHCIQCNRTMAYIGSHINGLGAPAICDNPNCPNYGLLQLGVEGMQK